MVCHFMQTFSQGDSLHEMSIPALGENVSLLSAESAQSGED